MDPRQDALWHRTRGLPQSLVREKAKPNEAARSSLQGGLAVEISLCETDEKGNQTGESTPTSVQGSAWNTEGPPFKPQSRKTLAPRCGGVMTSLLVRHPCTGGKPRTHKLPHLPSCVRFSRAENLNRAALDQHAPHLVPGNPKSSCRNNVVTMAGTPPNLTEQESHPSCSVGGWSRYRTWNPEEKPATSPPSKPSQ